MRHVFLLATLDDASEAQSLAEEAKKYLDSREDVSTQPRVLVKGNRVSVVGVSRKIADELRVWCSERRRPSR